MAREDKNKSEEKAKSKRRKRESETESEFESESESEQVSKREKKTGRRDRKSSKKNKRKRHSEYEEDSSDYLSSSESESESEEEERRRRKRRERKKKEEKERKKKKKKKKKKEKGKKGAVTNSWGKFGIIRETDMWNKRPEFTAWLQEVKQMNLESLPNWEEKQMFKDFMEDHNTATFPSKKYYNLDAYYKRKLEKEAKKGMKKIGQTEMTVFNDEEIRRQEMQLVRERQKAEEVEALKRSMQSGMAQAMKEQAQLREEMLYQYKIGNLEAAAAIQRRLDPDVAM